MATAFDSTAPLPAGHPRLRDKDFAFDMKGAPASVGAWVARWHDPAFLAERAHWLQQPEAPALYRLADGPTGAAHWARWQSLGVTTEADVVLLERRAAGWVAVAGEVCFPSHWSLADKIGHPLDFIHGPVPGLNDALARKIDALLDRLEPSAWPDGLGWSRRNWNLSASVARNQHPAQLTPRMTATTPPETIVLRHEEQFLWRLPWPEATVVAFFIHIVNTPLPELARWPGQAAALARQVATMAPAMQQYKGFVAVAPALVAWLQANAEAAP